MIQNIVGPPMQGLPAYGAKEKGSDAKGERSDSFEKALEERMSSKSSQKEPGTDKSWSPKVETANRAKEHDKQSQPEVSKKEPETTETRAAPKAMGPLNKKAAGEREKAIQKFMDSFESEFGIPPTRIVEAMANLDSSQIQKTPDETAEAVISQLDLSDQDKEKAAAMYAGLLKTLNQIEGQMRPPVMIASGEQAMSAPRIQERFHSALERKSAINNSLDKMNQKFWMTGGKAESALDAKNLNQGDNFGVENFKALDENSFDRQMLADDVAPIVVGKDGLREGAGPVQGNPQQSSLNPMDLQKLVKDLKQAAHKRNQNLEISPELLAQLKNQQVTQSEVDGADSEFDSASLVKGGNEESFSQLANQQSVQRFGQREQADSFSRGGDGSSSGSSKHSGLGKSSEKGEFTKALKTNAETINVDAIRNQNDLQRAALPTAGVAQAAIKMTPEDHDANVREIMNQAQYLVKNGGGEMKVEMSPEGLGHVHLKVMVENGKVNVQMAAESNEAKKAIESSLADLKSSLAAHKLSVDHVKVDVVAGTNTDNNARSDMNMNPNAQRDTTKQFWNQFQESFGNRGQRDGFFDVPSLKGYQTQNRDPLKPIEGESVKTRSLGEGKGRGIDLVA